MPVKSYTVNVSGPLYARYAAVLIFYHDSGKKNGSSFSNIFWVGQDSADINFTTDTSDINPFSRFTLRKALDKAAMGATQMDSFQQAEWTAFDGFLRSRLWEDLRRLRYSLPPLWRLVYARFRTDNGIIFFGLLPIFPFPRTLQWSRR